MNKWLLSSATAFQLQIHPMSSSTTVLVLRMLGPGSWLLKEVSQPELLRPTVQGLPKTRRCTEPRLIQKCKCRRLALVSHLWIPPGFHYPIRPLRNVLDVLGLSAEWRFWYMPPMNKKALVIVKEDLLSLKARCVCKDEGNGKGPETTVWAVFMHHNGKRRYKGNLSPFKDILTTPYCEHSSLLVYWELTASALSKFVRVLLMFTVLPQCSPWLIQLSSYILLAFQGFCDLSPLLIQQWHIICKWQCHVFCVSILYTTQPTDVFKPQYTTYIQFMQRNPAIILCFGTEVASVWIV